MKKIVLYRSFCGTTDHKFGMIMRITLYSQLCRIVGKLADAGFSTTNKGAVIAYDDKRLVDYMIDHHRENILGIMLYDTSLREYSGFKAKITSATRETFLNPPPPGCRNYMAHSINPGLISSHWALSKKTDVSFRVVSDYVIQMNEAEFCSMTLGLSGDVNLIEIVPQDFSVHLYDFIDVESTANHNLFSVSAN